MKKPIIAFDIDDVLSALAEKVVEFGNQKWGTNLTIDDYDEHWAKMFRLDDKQLLKHRDAIFSHYPHISHSPEAVDILKKLKEKYRLVIVTSRLKKVDQVTREWLEEYYPNTFTEIHYSGAWENPDLGGDIKSKYTKEQVLTALDANYLIDDQPKHCVAAAEAGITAILFGDYGWNTDIKLKPNMVRAKNWQEVREYFERQG